LHGAPQTHATWSKGAPLLARDFTVIAPDLRGYGDSSKPPSTPDHEPYSKRAMARDQVALMEHFGFTRFAVAGHDRGGRVAYRLALDHPERVSRLAVMDIVPTYDTFQRVDMGFALGYWHFFFLAQPEPLPEKMIEAYPDSFFGRSAPWTDPQVAADYRRCGMNPATVHAMCEDYRAAASFDYRLDESEKGKARIHCPVLALWGGKGRLGQWFDVLAVWREWADDVRGAPIESGHMLQEEAPDQTYEHLSEFFKA
jgi:haloacetate dehalogenase